MKLNKSELSELSEKEVFRRLLDFVTKSGDEIEEKETRGGKTTDLKIYIIDTPSEMLGNIEQTCENLSVDRDVSEHAKNFFESHIISEEKLGKGLWWLEIKTPRYERTDEFVLLEREHGFWALTTERKEWVEDTLEKLIKYVPSLERVYLSSDDLESVMRRISDSEFSGFTAKYHSPHRKRDATLRFHGAEPEDLDKAKEAFQATPTRIEFNQQNSPQTAIQGSGSSDGVLTAESIRHDSLDKATDTFLSISNDFTEVDSKKYAVQSEPVTKFFETGPTVDEFTSIELFGPDREDATQLGSEIEEAILSKHQYRFGKWGDSTYFVQDTHHEEIFELGIESPNLVLHAREETTALSLRSFCRNVFEEFDSTYSIRKKEHVAGGVDE